MLGESRESVDDDFADWLPDAANNLLVLSGCHGVCADLLAAVSSGPGAVLVVTAAGSVDGWIDRWQSRLSTPPERTAFVSVGEVMRSASGAQNGRVEQVDAPVSITAASDADDLAGIGGRILESIDDLAGGEVVCCVDSLAPFADDGATDRGFRTLHAVTHRVAAVDGVACYRLDPDAHDRETVRTFEPLFDAVVHRSGDEWRART